jgi:hypothetical protein
MQNEVQYLNRLPLLTRVGWEMPIVIALEIAAPCVDEGKVTKFIRFFKTLVALEFLYLKEMVENTIRI